MDAFELAVETPPVAKPRGDSSRPADVQSTPPQGGDRQQRGVARALAAAAPTPGTAMRQRAMSLGLSRRRSSAVAWPVHTALASSSKAGNASPLKLSMPPGVTQEAAQRQSMQPGGGRRSTLVPPGPHRLSVAADNGALMGSPGGGAGWAVSRHSLAMRGRRSSVAPSRLSGTGRMLSRLSVGLTDALQWLGIKGKIPTAAADEEAQAAAAARGGGGGALADRPALSPIASPGLDEEGSTSADDSPLAASMAVTALGQPLTADEASAAASSPAAQQAAVAEAPAAAVGEEVEAEAEAEAAAIEQLEEQLASQLQLQETAVEEDEEEAGQAAEQQVTAAAAAQQQQLAAEAEASAEEEELTPLQQLLQLCGQEVRCCPGMASGQQCGNKSLHAARSRCPAACKHFTASSATP